MTALGLRGELGLGIHAALEREKDQSRAAADTELIQQIRNVELDGTLGDIELAGDFLVGEIFEQGIENFLFAAAQVRHGIGFQAPALTGEDGINDAGKELARNPEPSPRHKRKGAGKLLTSLLVRKKSFYAEAKKRIGVVFEMLFPDDDQARIGITFEDIGEQGPRGL